jgi:hypothetical protein
MSKRIARIKWWQAHGAKPPAEYNECYLRALRRMAVTLNCYTPRTSPFSQRGLKKSDAQLQDLFPRTKIGSVDANAALVNHEQIDRHQDLEDFDHAENLFYGDFNFSCPRGFKDNCPGDSSLNSGVSTVEFQAACMANHRNRARSV